MRGITVATIVVLAPLTALADEPKDLHFENATKLKAEGKLAEACVEFKLALDANPAAVGLVLNVAQCNEDLGRTHTAKVQFKRLKQLAGELGLPEYARTADEHLAKLDRKPATLALTFDEPPDSATKVTVDDEVYDVMKDTTLEVNPGSLRLVVSHPGRVSREITLELNAGQTKAYHVARLATPKSVDNKWRNIGIVLTPIGGAAVIVGGVLGLVAAKNYNDQFKVNAAGPGDYCIKVDSMGKPIPPACGNQSSTNVKNALKLGDEATGIMIAGGVLAVGGATLWLVVGSREHKEKAVTLVPLVSPTQTGLAAVGHF